MPTLNPHSFFYQLPGRWADPAAPGSNTAAAAPAPHVGAATQRPSVLLLGDAVHCFPPVSGARGLVAYLPPHPDALEKRTYRLGFTGWFRIGFRMGFRTPR